MILFLFTVSHAWSEEKPLLTIVRGQNFEPYHYLDASGMETGFVIDTIRETARMAGFKTQFQQFPWTRCLKMVKNGEADAMMNLFKTPEREAFLHFSDNVIAYETNQFFVLSPPLMTYDGGFESIRFYRIGTIRNYSYGKAFDDFKFPNMFKLETEQELINTLINNRCDIIIGNKLAIRVLIRQMELADKITPLSPEVSFEPLFIGFSKARGHDRTAKKFSTQLKRFKQSKEYRNILKKYQSFSH